MATLDFIFTFFYTLFLAACAQAVPQGATYPGTARQPVQKDLTITWKTGNPNGNARPMIFVNDQFPSPTLEFNEGDDVEITVHNNLPFNTTIHWHGILMQGTPWSDGVPGLSQKPIEPGETFIYRFKAEPAGTYWYHAHSRADLLDGLYGALWIKPGPSTPFPWSMISSSIQDQKQIAAAAASPRFLIASDWTNFTSKEYMAAQQASELDLFCTDSILVNGKGAVFCPPPAFLEANVSPGLRGFFGDANVTDKGCYPFDANTEDIYLPGRPDLIPPYLITGCIPTTGSNETFVVDPADGWVSFNIVMAATFRAIALSIDEHDMWVYEMDGEYVTPQKVQVLDIYPGERYAVMVKLDRKPGNYTIRLPDGGIAQVVSAFATLSYKNAQPMPPSTPTVAYGGEILDPQAEIFNVYVPPLNGGAPAATADEVYKVTLGRFYSAWQWTFTGKGLYPEDWNSYTPLLYNPNSPQANDPDLVIRTRNGSWVDLIIEVGVVPSLQPQINHILHKHSSKVWVLGNGYGLWNYSSVAEAQRTSPQWFYDSPSHRDTVTTPLGFGTGTWTLVRYQVTNPGPWLLHCHVELHLAGGMGMAIMDGVDQWPSIPPEYGPDGKGL